MDLEDYQYIQTEINKLEKQIIQLIKRISRHQMMLSAKQVLDEQEKIETMLENDKKKLIDVQQKLVGVKWLLD